VKWLEEDGRLVAIKEFRDFAGAWAFASRIALLAEKEQHHPQVTVGWGKVEIVLTTHDAGNKVTDKDRAMAKAIEGLEG
jgi:4a-hydroxytetrahydrobiopterin dehydratase